MQAISTKNLHWTLHAKNKMQYYGLSESRVKRVLKNPRRVEEGIAENTIALMQPTSVKKRAGKEIWNQEIWVMAQKKGQQLKIISVWRYPGVAPQRSPIPVEIIRELEEGGLI